MRRISQIWIIDDDDICRFMLQSMLENTGQVGSVRQFRNGLEALDYLSQQQQQPGQLPDLIFLDLEMPFMDGWQFLEKYSLTGFTIPIYIVSSSTSLEDIDRSKTYALIKGYLIKPVFNVNILKVMDNFLAG
jgi:two-component system, chemotaxis family, chemotaxis protein CheY